MAIASIDTCIRANQSGIGTASDGETWTTGGQASTISLTSNEIVITASANVDTFAQIGSKTLTDQEVLCRLAVAGNTVDIAGPLARFTAASGTSCYKLLYYANAIHINKAVTGTNTNLANSGGFTLTNGVFYWFRLNCTGTTITGKVWQDGAPESGALTISTTDSSIASGGFAILAQGNSAGGVSFDHFQATDGGHLLFSDGYGGVFS